VDDRPDTDPMTREGLLRLYDEQAPLLLRYFARAVLDPEAAADLTAETFAQAVEHRVAYDPARGAPAAWLFGIARNQLRHYLRRGRVERVARKRVGLASPALSAVDFVRVERLIDLAALAPVVAAALDNLSSEQRSAVTRRVIDEWAYADIAKEAHCSEQAARARVSRGLRALGLALGARRSTLEPSPQEPE
jgi:RNA polymerase sigma factor (sigma-70 family)